MRYLLLLAFFSSLLCAEEPQKPTTHPFRLIGMVEVGKVSTDCDHVTKAGRRAELPEGFLIYPDSAFRKAHEKIQFRCPSKFGNILFADGDFYYITVGPFEAFLEKQKTITPAILKDRTIRVHGLTGKVFPPTIVE